MIYEILYKKINKNNTKFVDLLTKYDNYYTFEPYFNIIINDGDLISHIKEYVFDEIKLYLQINKTDIDFNDISKNTLENKKLLYMIYNFMSDCLIPILTLVNRKNYGTCDDIKENIILPYLYVDKPAVSTERIKVENNQPQLIKKGENVTIIIPEDICKFKIDSQFTNPLLILGLTIVDYIIKNLNTKESFLKMLLRLF